MLQMVSLEFEVPGRRRSREGEVHRMVRGLCRLQISKQLLNSRERLRGWKELFLKNGLFLRELVLCDG